MYIEYPIKSINQSAKSTDEEYCRPSRASNVLHRIKCAIYEKVRHEVYFSMPANDVQKKYHPLGHFNIIVPYSFFSPSPIVFHYRDSVFHKGPYIGPTIQISFLPTQLLTITYLFLFNLLHDKLSVFRCFHLSNELQQILLVRFCKRKKEQRLKIHVLKVNKVLEKPT